jgi:hypothetical protein
MYQLGEFYENNGGYYAGSILLKNSINHYFVIEQECKSWQLKTSNSLNILYYYQDSESLNLFTNSYDQCFDGKFITENYLNTPDYPAGYYCNKFKFMNFYDYFLPSIHELFMMFKNKDHFNKNCPVQQKWMDNVYWSSSKYSNSASWYIDFLSKQYKASNNKFSHFFKYVRKIEENLDKNNP